MEGATVDSLEEFLLLRLHGVLQAWGGHTYEDFRPSEVFPTRSGLVGLLGACLGIDRQDEAGLTALSEGFRYAARADARTDVKDQPLRVVKITDYHTVLGPRLVPGSTRKGAVVSRREYLCDAQFTVALQFLPQAAPDLTCVRQAVQHPVYTPFLGRRSCPLTQPLYCATVRAADLHAALAQIPPGRGVIYSEVAGDSPNRFTVRDVPYGGRRRFMTRTVYIHAEGGA